MAKRSELSHLQNKLSDVIVLGRTKLIRSPKWHTIDQSKEVHYCSLSLQKAQPAISVDIGSSLFVKSTHAEGSHDAKSSECTVLTVQIFVLNKSLKRFVLRSDKSRHKWNLLLIQRLLNIDFISLFLPGS